MHTTRTRMFPNPSLYAYSSTTSQPAIAPTLSSLPTQAPLPLDGDGTKCGWIEDAGAYEWGRSEHTICPVKSWCFFPRLPSAVSSAVRRRTTTRSHGNNGKWCVRRQCASFAFNDRAARGYSRANNGEQKSPTSPRTFSDAAAASTNVIVFAFAAQRNRMARNAVVGLARG